MRTPRLAALNDVENRLRRDWQDFIVHWQATAEVWKDRRRQQFEEEYLNDLPAMLTRTTAELTQFRESLQQAMRTLADNEVQS